MVHNSPHLFELRFQTTHLEAKRDRLEKENIDIPGGGKRPTHSMIERIQHKHAHQVGDEEIGEIVRGFSPPSLYSPRKAKLTEKGSVGGH